MHVSTLQTQSGRAILGSVTYRSRGGDERNYWKWMEQNCGRI